MKMEDTSLTVFVAAVFAERGGGGGLAGSQLARPRRLSMQIINESAIRPPEHLQNALSSRALLLASARIRIK